MEFNNLSDEFKVKALKCKTAEELFELAKSEGVDLNDDQLAAVSGGVEWGCSDNDLDW